MDTNMLIVGNIALASVIIKTLVSTVKLMIPSLVGKKSIIQIITVASGIVAAFAVNAQLIPMEDPSAFMVILQKVISGVFIAATAMGIHETSKTIPTKR